MRSDPEYQCALGDIPRYSQGWGAGDPTQMALDGGHIACETLRFL
jgi:hypothetical protein